MDEQGNRIIIRLSFLVCILLVIVSCVGLLFPNTYSADTPSWTAQALGQDIFDLFLVVPFLLITVTFIRKRSRKALLMWSGAVLYLIYSFVIYCFAVHFNNLFIVYCSILGLSFYAFVYYLVSQLRRSATDWFGETVSVKSVGYYFIAISCIFYLLWLSEVVPSIMAGTIPKNIIEMGLLTNPVHALDLSITLPGILIVGILLLRRKTSGLLLAPSILIFMILMDITIGGLNIIMQIRGLEGNYIISMVMAVLALVSAWLLIRFLKSVKPIAD
ncbi:MAG: hypothetical protein OEV79_08545 [candidate division WOR-3 bacterium]|nr:hypothetical protein [candidate division WOR-3 bacterium]